MSRKDKKFCLLLTAALLVSALPAHAKTHREAYDACSISNHETCASLRSNLKYYMDIHRRGGPTNESFLFETFWRIVKPIFPQIAQQIGIGIINETAVRGTFMDAQEKVRSQGALQAGAAEAARNYLPSEQLCRYASLSQSLAADDTKMRVTQMSLANSSIRRDLGTKNSTAQAGAASDRNARMTEYIKEYCDTARGNLDLMCGGNPQRTFGSVARDTRFDKDINFTRTIEGVTTVESDFINAGNIKPGDQDVVALSSNLYGSRQMSGRVPETMMKDRSGQNVYFQTRSVSAARNVAQNSYAAITAMKSQGSTNTRPFIKALMTELGVQDESMTAGLSEKPSYFTQMEFLTKKIFQSPTFFVNLMEGKTNVARQSDAMEGIELMQDRDIYNSMRRSEMLLALMIQLESRKALDDVVEER